MIRSWKYFWAFIANLFRMSYEVSATGVVLSSKYLSEAIKDTDLKTLNEDLKALGLYIE